MTTSPLMRRKSVYDHYRNDEMSIYKVKDVEVEVEIEIQGGDGGK